MRNTTRNLRNRRRLQKIGNKLRREAKQRKKAAQPNAPKAATS